MLQQNFKWKFKLSDLVSSGFTIDSRAADQVGVGEVQGSLRTEVHFHGLPDPLAEVKEQTGTLQRHRPLLSKL